MTCTRLAMALLLACLAMPAFAGGDPEGADAGSNGAGDRTAADLPPVSSAPPLAGAPADLSCNGDPDQIVGHVVALAGSVHAQRPGEDQRALACNDAIHACDTLLTTAGSRVGVLTGNLYAHVDTDSRLQIGTAGDQPSLMLHAGGLRVIDPRGAGAAAVPMSTPHVATQALGTDTELFVSDPSRTRLCNHLASLRVAGTGGGDPLDLASGCAVSSGLGVAAAPASDPSIGVQETPSCEIELAGMFTPYDVSADIGFDAFPNVAAADNWRRGACEASNCRNQVTPQPPPRRIIPPRPPSRFRVVDPTPGTGCGGAGFGCGGNND